MAVVLFDGSEMPTWGPRGTDAYRAWMKAYMRQYRLGRVLRGRRRPPGQNFSRPGHCENCGHRWPEGGRCPMCALAVIPQASPARAQAAWAQLMAVPL